MFKFKCLHVNFFFYISYNSLVQLVQYSWSCPAPVPSGIWWRAKEPRSYLSPTLHLSVLATSHLANDPSVSGRVAVSRDSCIFSHAQIEASGLVLICESTTIFSQGRGHRGLAAESRVLKWNISNRSKIYLIFGFSIYYLGPPLTSNPAADVTPNPWEAMFF